MATGCYSSPHRSSAENRRKTCEKSDRGDFIKKKGTVVSENGGNSGKKGGLDCRSRLLGGPRRKRKKKSEWGGRTKHKFSGGGVLPRRQRDQKADE